MLRSLVILALAVATCSALNIKVPESILEYHNAAVATGGSASEGLNARGLYFPCNNVRVNNLKGLQLNRFSGRWFDTNSAFSVSSKIDPDRVQEYINAEVGCVKSSYNFSGAPTTTSGTTDIIKRNGTDIPNPYTARLLRAGDNGLWLAKSNLGNNVTFFQDVWWVATDYTSFNLWYTCSDVPVPGTLDTKREQQWGLERRWPRNFNRIQLAVFRAVALANGIVDIDQLYSYPTDMCRPRPSTTTTTTTETTPTTTTTETTPTTSTTETTPTTSTTETTPTTESTTDTTSTTTTEEP